MAKPKLPKKNNNVKEVVPAPNSPAASSDVNLGTNPGATLGPQETLTAVTVPEPKKSEPKKTARKPEIVKTEPRSNLVPINLEDEIRRIAEDPHAAYRYVRQAAMIDSLRQAAALT